MFYGHNSKGGFEMRLNFVPTHVFRIWEKDQIKRIKFEPIQSREKIS